jgi:hypothetical protein
MAVCSIAAALFLYVYDRASITGSAEKKISGYPFPKPRHEIRGFRFDGTSGDKRVITIEADRFRIEKKKVGFFRFGMMNVARLENASIHIFKSVTGQEAGVDSAFKDAFSKDALPTFSTKRVSTIEMEPVCVSLYEGESVLSRIKADSAIVRLKNRDVSFKGNVEVASGPRLLITDRLSLIPEKALLKTEGHFVLETNNTEERGDNLTADIFLRPVRQ